MIRRPAILTLVAAIAFASAPISARAQAPAEQSVSEQEWSWTQTISVSFAGGTVSNFVAAVQNATKPAELNVIYSDEVGSIQMPAVNLKRVSVQTAIETIEWIYAEHPLHRFSVGSYGAKGGGEPVYAIVYRKKAVQNSPAGFSMTGKELQVLSLAELMSESGSEYGLQLDAILSAVDAALALTEGEPAEVRYHQDSKLLIVRGNGLQVHTVDQVLDRLRESVHTDRIRSRNEQAKQDAAQMDDVTYDIRSLSSACSSDLGFLLDTLVETAPAGQKPHYQSARPGQLVFHGTSSQHKVIACALNIARSARSDAEKPGRDSQH